MIGLHTYLCLASEIREGEIRSFEVPWLTHPVLVTRVEGEVIAGASMCPHEDVSLAKRGRIEGDHIVCSAHGYAFRLSDGGCLHDPRLRWSRYQSVVQDDKLYVRFTPTSS